MGFWLVHLSWPQYTRWRFYFVWRCSIVLALVMQKLSMTIEPADIALQPEAVIFDCRFSLFQTGEGEALYHQGHIPGAHYLHLERDLSAPVRLHGGRHPLPDPNAFASLLADFGVSKYTVVIAYDDHRHAYAARLWWLMKSLGFKPPVLINGGYRAWLASGGQATTAIPLRKDAGKRSTDAAVFSGHCDIDGLRVAQGEGTVVVDSREEKRFLGLEEPIDPIAGHIPAAVNRPWQGVTDSSGHFLSESGQRAHWGEILEDDKLIVYCGSGVTACVNLFSLSLLGRDDAVLYAGSWSDWCSYL